MFVVGGHTFEAQHGEFFQRAQVFILVAQHTFLATLCLVVGLFAAPQYLVIGRQLHIMLFGDGQQLLFHGDTFVYSFEDAGIVEVGIGDTSEQCVYEIGVNACNTLHASLANGSVNSSNTAHHAQ